MKRISIGFHRGKGIYLAIFAMTLFLLLASSPAQATTDYVFFTINSDTSLNAMTQGDTVGWGCNCAVGALLTWQIWVDVDTDGIIDMPGDRLIFEFDIHDGDTSPDGPPPDINPVPDGWYVINPMLMGIAPAHYIFRVYEDESRTAAFRSLLSNPAPDPPNIFRGQLIVDGHPGPDPDLLGHLWVEASEERAGGQMWSALSDENGNYQINITDAGSGIEFRIAPPSIEGYMTPSTINMEASGVIENIDFVYGAPTDSIFGEIRDDNGDLITANIGGHCNRMDGSGDKDFQAVNGQFAIYFGSSDYGRWSIGLDYENLFPTFLAPSNREVDNSLVHSQRLDFMCYRSNALLYARVTENDTAPTHRYMVTAQSMILQCGTQAASDTGINNIATLHITSADASNWSVGVSTWDYYPVPPGYVLENENLNNHAPGDTVILNFIAGVRVSDTVKVDAGDPEPNWNMVWVSVGRDGHYFGSNPNGDGVFTLYADTGVYSLGVNFETYLAYPTYRDLHLIADTTGGLSFTLNNRHCRISGILTNIPLPINQNIGVPAHTSSDNNGYSAMLQVDSATGQFYGYLCDGEWTLDPPMINNRFAPGQGHLSIAEFPDTVKYIEFVYIDPSSVEEDNPVPTEYTLMQNYPNPFNGQTVIRYGLPEANQVTIEIYDLLGRLVESIQDGVRNAGYHNSEWNAVGQPSGIYFYRIKAGDFTEMRKMLLLK